MINEIDPLVSFLYMQEKGLRWGELKNVIYLVMMSLRCNLFLSGNAPTNNSNTFTLSFLSP